MTRLILPGALLLATACASAPPSGPATPAGTLLAYAMPPAANTYEFSDSSGFIIQGGPLGEIKATVRTAGTAEVAYAARGDTVEATIRVTDFSGTFSNSAAPGGRELTESEIEGPAVVSVTPRGVANVSTLPKLSADVQRVGIASAFFRRFFVRLPAERVQRGAIWVDTIAATEDQGGTRSEVRDIVTSTFAGDSTINGRSLAVIHTSIARSLNISGVNEGLQIQQKLSGSARGTIFWDAARNVLVERTETTELTGTFDLPAMNLTGLPLNAAGTSRMVLK